MVEVTDKIPRKRGVSVIVFILFIATIYLYISYIAGKILSVQSFYNIYMAQWLPNTVILLLLAPVFYIIYLILSYNGDKKSKLYGLKPLAERLPGVSKPDKHVLFREKLFWTGTVLVLYFALCNIFIYGLSTTNIIDVFASFRAILAGASGTLMQLGIGPIVTASIIMQLFVGAKIINFDLTKEEDKSMYQQTQKMLVIIMILVEAIPQVFGYLNPSTSFITLLNGVSAGQGLFLARTLIVAQIFFGSYLVFLMDELVSKWGIGSGISLFIAAGVAQATFTGIINWIPSNVAFPISLANPPSGVIPKTAYLLINFSSSQLYAGRIETILFAPPNPIVALIGTVLIFLIVVWTESTKVELPLSHERARGARGRYPIKLMYASNIPVILTTALLANVAMWTMIFWTNPALAHIPLLGHNPLLGVYPTTAQAAMYGINQTTPIGGLAYYLNQINGISEWLLPLMEPAVYQAEFLGHTYWQALIRVFAFTAFMIGMSILFAIFWIDTTNMNAKAVAKQIQSSGMQIPGFRREPKVIESVLDKYIPAITIFSGAAIGALAAAADLIGTIGNTTGTGLLLAVGITIQFYEAMGREQLMEMHPVVRQFFEG